MKSALLLITLVITLFTSCRESDEVSRARVENELRSNLAVGDTSEKIERVLAQKKIPFTFDRFNSCYQARIDPKEKSTIPRVISVSICVDQAKRLSKIEVHNNYTYL